MRAETPIPKLTNINIRLTGPEAPVNRNYRCVTDREVPLGQRIITLQSYSSRGAIDTSRASGSGQLWPEAVAQNHVTCVTKDRTHPVAANFVARGPMLNRGEADGKKSMAPSYQRSRGRRGRDKLLGRKFSFDTGIGQISKRAEPTRNRPRTLPSPFPVRSSRTRFYALFTVLPPERQSRE